MSHSRSNDSARLSAHFELRELWKVFAMRSLFCLIFFHFICNCCVTHSSHCVMKMIIAVATKLQQHYFRFELNGLESPLPSPISRHNLHCFCSYFFHLNWSMKYRLTQCVPPLSLLYSFTPIFGDIIIARSEPHTYNQLLAVGSRQRSNNNNEQWTIHIVVNV